MLLYDHRESCTVSHAGASETYRVRTRACVWGVYSLTKLRT